MSFTNIVTHLWIHLVNGNAELDINFHERVPSRQKRKHCYKDWGCGDPSVGFYAQAWSRRLLKIRVLKIFYSKYIFLDSRILTQWWIHSFLPSFSSPGFVSDYSIFYARNNFTMTNHSDQSLAREYVSRDWWLIQTLKTKIFQRLIIKFLLPLYGILMFSTLFLITILRISEKKTQGGLTGDEKSKWVQGTCNRLSYHESLIDLNPDLNLFKAVVS